MEVEKQIKEDLKVTIRCIPTAGQIPGAEEPGRCVITGEPSPRRVLFAKSY
jgi:prolyl-tRNA synthetase